MFQHSLRSTAVAAVAAILSVPLGATSAQTQTPLNQHNTARVEVTHGRAVLIGSDVGCQTIREGDREGTVGRSQLEIPTGSEARISWPGTCSVRVYGPSSIEWDCQGATLGLKFHELAWADFECRGGQHELFLPSEWSGTFGRSAFHVRGITGGPCEFRLQAGEPVSLQWDGSQRATLPPLQVLPGSSVRLDRPRFMNAPVAKGDASGSWSTSGEQVAWPWSPETGPGYPTEVRFGGDPTQGNGATSASIPAGGEPTMIVPEAEETCPVECQTTRLSEFPEDDASAMCQEGLEPYCDEEATLAQVPVDPGMLTVEVEPTSTTPNSAVMEPTTPAIEVVEINATEPDMAVAVNTEAPQSNEPGAVMSPEAASSEAPSSETPTSEIPSIESEPMQAEPTKAQPSPIPDPGPSPEVAPEPEPEPEPAVFTPVQWRGFTMDDLNHAGCVVAERSSDVEYRILGQGRCKIIVSGTASQPRWCFTPKVDLQMQPGSVAIIEKDGTLRMSFGEVEEFEIPTDRPSFDEFED